jgi:hypothetical protein
MSTAWHHPACLLQQMSQEMRARIGTLRNTGRWAYRPGRPVDSVIRIGIGSWWDNGPQVPNPGGR